MKKPKFQTGREYATNNIVDLDNYNEDSSPEVTWEEYHKDVAEAFNAGSKNVKELSEALNKMVIIFDRGLPEGSIGSNTVDYAKHILTKVGYTE